MEQAHSHENKLTKDFSVKEALSYGWNQLKENTGTLVGTAAVVMVGSFVLSYLSGLPQNKVVQIVLSIISYVLNMALSLGFTYIVIELYHGREVGIGDIFTPLDKLWRYIAASILYGLAVAVGMVLLIIPGIYAALTFFFYAYAIVEEDKGPIEALKRSHEITTDTKWRLLWFLLATAGLNMLGALVVGVGLLVTVPIVMMATVSIYFILREATDGTTPPDEYEGDELPEEE